MNNQQIQFLNLLKAALWNENAEHVSLPTSAEEWNQLLVEAQRQTVAPLLFDWIQKQPPLQNFPIDKGRKLLALSIRTGQMHARLRQTLKELDEQLQGIGVNGVLLKGEGVATVYPRPDARACGDIDFYVGKENYKKVCDFLNQQGLVDEEFFETDKHLHATMNGNVTVEIHRVAALATRFWCNGDLERWMDVNIKPHEALLGEDTKVLLPEPTFDAFFLFYHGYYHFLESGVGIRQICDWMLHMNCYADVIDRNALKEVLEMLGLMRAWSNWGSIAVKYLGLAEEKIPFYTEREECDAVLETIFRDGNFGQYNVNRGNRPKSYYLGKLYSFRNHVQRVIDLFHVAGMDAFYYFVSMLITGVKAAVLHK